MTNEEIIFEIMKQGAEGAIPNGSRVEKVIGEEEDHHPIGSKGKVVGSLIAPPKVPIAEKYVCDYAYLIQFDGDEAATFILGSKIKQI